VDQSGEKWIHITYDGEQNLLRGLNALTLDGKGRMAIPTKYREHLQDNGDKQLVITVDPNDSCLLLYPQPEWEVIERKLVRLPALNRQARKLQRLLLGHATEVEMDGAGRILLQPLLRECAHLDKRVMLVGQGNKFELWDEQHWSDCREQWLAEDDGELAEDLETLSL